MLFDYPKLSVEFEDLWWDDVQFEHNGTFTAKLVSWWFHRWMPPVNPSTPRPEDLVGFIHSATVDEKWICIDFGTASIDALFNLMSVAINCGATTARVTSTRDRKQNRNGAAHSFLTH